MNKILSSLLYSFVPVTTRYYIQGDMIHLQLNNYFNDQKHEAS